MSVEVNVGDQIMVTDAVRDSPYKNGEVLTVTYVYGDGGDVKASSERGGEDWVLFDREFVLVSDPVGRVIAFNDIREGDRIQVSFSGDDLIKIGIVVDLNEGWWRTLEGRLVVGRRSPAVITLLDRPKPELPVEIGSVVIATEVRGVKGRWELFLGINEYWICVDAIDGFNYHKPRHITEWQSAHIVPLVP